MADPASTAIGRDFARAASRHPGQSGFALLREGRAAFTARIALTDLAQKTLDLQYYIWEPDATGHILAERLVRAADRGVRVRVLLDDINLKGRDVINAALDAHPNIEIRHFNPLAQRGSPGLAFLTEFRRVNHRMHNKLIVMDNAMAIVGGRNIGDHYFGVDPETNFRDLDIAAGGPVVQEMSAVFDHFWNGPWSVPIAALAKEPATGSDLQVGVKTLREGIATHGYPYPLDEDAAALRGDLKGVAERFIWAPGRMLWADPREIQQTGRTTKVLGALKERAARLRKELLIESAYFVPGRRGGEDFRRMTERGVRVRVLTNSLASNDVLAAHAGYAKYRKALIASGVELYELRPYPGPVEKEILLGSSKAALHTKAIVFDREDVFIGSFNLDPRSSVINTEAGLFVESPELAAHVIDYLDEGVAAQNAYRVLLDADGRLAWLIEAGGQTQRYDKDPQSTAGQRATAGLIGILPVEGQL